jgi:mannonate dehydratase
MDNGYYDMYKIMKALRDTDFDGIVIPDHVPRMDGPVAPDAPPAARWAANSAGRAALAYSIAYMRALRDRANHEAKA